MERAPRFVHKLVSEAGLLAVCRCLFCKSRSREIVEYLTTTDLKGTTMVQQMSMMV